MSVEYHKFSDFSEEVVGLEGDKKKIEEILNTKILVVGYRIGKSKYKEKEYLTLQFENGLSWLARLCRLQQSYGKIY